MNISHIIKCTMDNTNIYKPIPLKYIIRAITGGSPPDNSYITRVTRDTQVTFVKQEYSPYHHSINEKSPNVPVSKL